MQKLPPANREAEEAVLGGILIDNGMFVPASEIVGPDDFSLEKHIAVFRALQRLDQKGRAFDLVTVSDELEQAGMLDAVGGPAYIVGLMAAVPTSVHTVYYAEIVYRLSVQRQFIKASQQIAQMAWADDVESAEDLASRVEQVVASVGQKLRPQMASATEIIDQMLDEVWNPSGKATSRVFTGFPGVDGPMLGIESGRFWAVAAVPGTGKTAWSLNLVRGVARTNKGKVAVLYFHPEQPKEEIAQLLWCSGTDSVLPIRLKVLMTTKKDREMFVRAAGFVDTSTQARRNGNAVKKTEYLLKDLEQWENEALTASRNELDGTSIKLVDPSGKNIYQINAIIRQHRAKLPPDTFLLVVFDGAHLISGTGEGSRYAELVAITRNLKIAAQNLVTDDGNSSGAIIANTQLNREIFREGANRVYRMSQLRDSGSWEADADAVLCLDRPSVFNNGIAAGGKWDEFKLIALKNRQTGQLFTSYWEMHRLTMMMRGKDLV